MARVRSTRGGGRERNMASEDKSFADLVAESPAAPAEGTVRLVGALAKSREAGKFVLTLQDGRTVTLETSAVKGHTVLGSSLGRAIVRIEVEASKAPVLRRWRVDRKNVLDPIGQGGYEKGFDTTPLTSEKDPLEKYPVVETDPFTSEKTDPVETDPLTDKDPIETDPLTSEKVPPQDTFPLQDTDPLADGTTDPTADGITDPVADGATDPTADGTGTGAGETDPAADGAGTGSFEFIPPFALATPHQAPPHVVRALQARAGYARRFGGQGWARGALHRKPVLDNAKVFQDSYGTGYWGDVTMGPADIW
jgi:hypothetical protein